MTYNAIIYKTGFTALLEPMYSTIRLHVVLPDEDRVAVIQEENTIEFLSNKYGFIVNQTGWDLRNMHCRKCIVEIAENEAENSFVMYREN